MRNNINNIRNKINTLNNKNTSPRTNSPPPRNTSPRNTSPRTNSPPPRNTSPRNTSPRTNSPPPRNNSPRNNSPRNNSPPPRNNSPPPRNNSPRNNSPRNNSPRNTSARTNSPPPRNIPNTSSNSKPIKKTFEKVKNITSDVASKLKEGTKKLQSVLTGKTVNTIIKVFVGIAFLISIVIMILFYNTLNKHFRTSILYLIYSLLTLMISLFVMPIIFSDSSTLGQIISLVIIGLATFFFAVFTKKFIEYLKSSNIDSPYLVKGMKNAKKSLVIEQNPDNDENIILYRSDNEEGGIEFSYSFWILVNDFTFKDKNMKHVFHKGDSKAKVSYTPAVWIHPDKNTIRINMNTIQSKDNIIDIDNMPINKWIHISIVVKQKVVTIYVNGNIKKSKHLQSIPRQNFGNVWINLFGGFDGYLSKLKYTRRALSYSEVENMVSKGPSSKISEPAGASPPYLTDDWWLK
jgi:hypothetical protein